MFQIESDFIIYQHLIVFKGEFDSTSPPFCESKVILNYVKIWTSQAIFIFPRYCMFKLKEKTLCFHSYFYRMTHGGIPRYLLTLCLDPHQDPQ